MRLGVLGMSTFGTDELMVGGAHAVEPDGFPVGTPFHAPLGLENGGDVAGPASRRCVRPPSAAATP